MKRGRDFPIAKENAVIFLSDVAADGNVTKKWKEAVAKRTEKTLLSIKRLRPNWPYWNILTKDLVRVIGNAAGAIDTASFPMDQATKVVFRVELMPEEDFDQQFASLGEMAHDLHGFDSRFVFPR